MREPTVPAEELPNYERNREIFHGNCEFWARQPAACPAHTCGAIRAENFRASLTLLTPRRLPHCLAMYRFSDGIAMLETDRTTGESVAVKYLERNRMVRALYRSCV